jgi:hypothetical protein
MTIEEAEEALGQKRGYSFPRIQLPNIKVDTRTAEEKREALGDIIERIRNFRGFEIRETFSFPPENNFLLGSISLTVEPAARVDFSKALMERYGQIRHYAGGVSKIDNEHTEIFISGTRGLEAGLRPKPPKLPIIVKEVDMSEKL